MDWKLLVRDFTAMLSKHKVLIIILVLIQLIVFALAGYATMMNLQKVVEGTQGVLAQLEQANVDPEKINEGQPFLNDMMPIYRSYQIMKEYTLRWLGEMVAIAVTLCAGLWLGSYYCNTLPGVEPRLGVKKAITIQALRWFRFTVLLLITTILFLFISSSMITFSTLENQDQFTSQLKNVSYLFVGIYYFFLCVAAQIAAPQLKDVFTRSFNAGVKKIHYSFPLAILLGSIIIATGYLVRMTLERSTSVILLSLATLFLAIVIVITRIVWIRSQQEFGRDAS